MTLKDLHDNLQVIDDYPPIYDEIAAAFPVQHGVMYSWGDKIYAPGGITVPPELLWHEAVHGFRQGNDIIGWWHRYIDEPEFRLQEEIPAHCREYEYIKEHGNRKERRVMLNQIAQRLSSPLYGRMVKMKDAKRIIQSDYDI